MFEIYIDHVKKYEKA